MTALIDIETILAEDLARPVGERCLPWVEQRDGITVVVEPKPHWAADMCVFRLDARRYCYHADWIACGARARFFYHVDTCGADLLARARAMIEAEIAEGLWG